jgi:hypothetical protein
MRDAIHPDPDRGRAMPRLGPWRRTMAAAEPFAPDFTEAAYWWEAAPPSTAALPALPDRVEVMIVGAGYCGLSAALGLRRHGVGVLVVDAARIGHGAIR